MSQGPLCPNLSQKVQAEVSQMANRNLSRVILLGGLSVNLNHLKTTDFSLKIGDTVIKPVTETKFLGLWLDHKLTWKKHYTELINKLNHSLNLLRKAKKLLNSTGLTSLYYAHFHSHLTYAMIVWSGMYGKGKLNTLQKKQNHCIKIVCNVH